MTIATILSVLNYSSQTKWYHLDKIVKEEFIEYLERFYISEFSSFIVFKELSLKLEGRHPIVSEMFNLKRGIKPVMYFLNKAMVDFK
ncbi:MAG: hypothetical protein ACQJCO_05770 [cyanobacterium endosymbiont of Rhopalodia sterrenbergii]